MSVDYAAMSPAEVDSQLSELYEQGLRASSKLQTALASMYDQAGAKSVTQYGVPGWSMPESMAWELVAAKAFHGDTWARDRADKVLREIQDLRAQLAAIRKQEAPLEAEYERRQWTRAFLCVTSGQGHVHRSMRCSTCFPTTRFNWLPQLSGAPEAEIVGLAGERACTVCYPSAPVEVRSRPTQLYTPDEIAAQQAREQRAAAKAERDAVKAAKAITAPDGNPLRLGYERIDTVYLAEQEYVHSVEMAAHDRQQAARPLEAAQVARYQELAAEYDAKARLLLEALAAKYGTSVEVEKARLAKRVAKRLREYGVEAYA